MDDIFPVVDSRLCLSQAEAKNYSAAHNSFTTGYSARLPLFTQCGLTWKTTFIVTAEMTTTLGEVHVHFIENSMTVASLHWRIHARKFTVREEMPPRTSPKLQQSEHIVCKISRRRKFSHDAHNSNQVLKLCMHLLQDLWITCGVYAHSHCDRQYMNMASCATRSAWSHMLQLLLGLVYFP